MKITNKTHVFQFDANLASCMPHLYNNVVGEASWHQRKHNTTCHHRSCPHVALGSETKKQEVIGLEKTFVPLQNEKENTGLNQKVTRYGQMVC